MMLACGVVVAAFAVLVDPLPACAQTLPAQRQEQRQRARHQARQRERLRHAPHVRLQKSLSTDYRQHALPTESPCFKLTSITLDGQRLDAFAFVSKYLRGYAGRCVGRRGLDLIVRRATDLILHRGYVTTRLLVPKQDLAGGKLRLLLVPGTVGRIYLATGSAYADWRNALPLRPGDLLNLRAIEQGLEQMKRVPSQDVHIDIAPGDKPGVSDLVLNVQRTCCWRGSISYDDAGSDYTGKQQGGVQLAFDQPLDANDLLSFGLTGYVGNDRHVKGFQSNSLRYSIPWDYWTFAVSSYGYSYHRHVHGVTATFRASGQSRTSSLSAKRVLHRSSSSVTSIKATLGMRQAHSSIDGVEIRVQRRHTTAITLALMQRRYIGNAQLDVSLAQRRGEPWLGGQTDGPGHAPGGPTFDYVINTLDAQLSLPFHGGRRPFVYTGTLHIQSTRDYLYADDFITIGGLYTVRGFDGEQSLGGGDGWFWRNSVGTPLGRGVRIYGGIDAGRVGGHGVTPGQGHALSGVFVGLRGSEYGINWNAFAGWSLRAPQQFSTRRPAVGMQVIYPF